MTTTTARAITFKIINDARLVTDVKTFPAGTPVAVSRLRDDECLVRVRGSLYEQTVNLDSVIAPE